MDGNVFMAWWAKGQAGALGRAAHPQPHALPGSTLPEFLSHWRSECQGGLPVRARARTHTLRGRIKHHMPVFIKF